MYEWKNEWNTPWQNNMDKKYGFLGVHVSWGAFLVWDGPG